MTDQGRIVWHDLMSTDLQASEKFFTELFGWEVKELDMGSPQGAYHMLANHGKDIGGIVPLDTGKGVPSHWISYVAVEDVDTACNLAENNGGEVPVPATDIPNIGRFAVIKDPTGGCISPFRTATQYTPETDAPPETGSFCWEELLTDDVDTAKNFYGKIFGWSDHAMDMGEAGTYTIFKGGAKDRAGTMSMPPEADAPPHWLSYVYVEDVDACATKITELGGKVFVEPRDIPGIGRFCVGADPTGAMFAVYKSTRS